MRDAELCWFAAGATTSPISQYLRDTDVTCVAASADIRLPAFPVNVFARRGRELISDSALLVSDGVGPRVFTLTSARPVGTALGRGERAAVYVVRTASILPGLNAPANELVVPLVLKGDRIVRVELGQRQDRGEGAGFVVVVPVVFAPDTPPRRSLPQITIGSRAPDVPLVSAQSSLVFFRDVPKRSALVSLTGEGWKARDVPVPIEAVQVITTSPLPANVVSNLTVHWAATADLLVLAKQPADCESAETDRAPDAPTKFAANLLRLPSKAESGPRPEMSGIPEIPIAMREFSLSDLRGNLRYEDIPDGQYSFRLTHPVLPPIEVELDVAGETEIDVPIDYITITGTIRKGTNRVHAHVLRTVSDKDTGTFSALLANVPPPATLLEVKPCDGSPPYRFVPSVELTDNTVLDIEIPDNQLTIRVSDAATDTPIDAAQITYATGHGNATLQADGGLTDAEGVFIIAPATPTDAFTVCADAKGYQRACGEPVRIDLATKRTVEIRLLKSTGRRGQVSLGGDKTGRVFWSLPTGRVTETATVNMDGTFLYQQNHDEGETVTYVGRFLPLIAQRQTRPGPHEVFEIRMPNPARVRTVSVSLSSQSREEAAFVTIMLGDIVIPAAVMDHLLSVRGAPRSIRPGAATTIAHVVESAPLTVVLLPFSLLQQSKFIDELDSAFLPDVVAAFPRKQIGNEGSIEFP